VRKVFNTIKLGNNSTLFINGRRLLKRGLAGFKQIIRRGADQSNAKGINRSRIRIGSVVPPTRKKEGFL